MQQSVLLITQSSIPSDWEAAIKASISATDRNTIVCSAETYSQTIEATRSEIALIIDLSECGVGIDLAEKHDIPVRLLCHGPDIRMDLENSIQTGFVEHQPYIEIRIVEWRTENKAAKTVDLCRLRSRKTPARSIGDVRDRTVNWLANTLSRTDDATYYDTQKIQITSGIAPASWRLRLTTLINLARIVKEQCLVEEWNVGTIKGDPKLIFNGSLMNSVDWLPPNPSLCFRGDPFGWHDEKGNTVLLYEGFDFRDGKGRIVRNINGKEEVIGDFACHASYPFLIQNGDQLYAIPEMSEKASPAAYPVTSISEEWEESGVLLDGLQGIPLVDASITHHEGRYWLFGTRLDQDPDTTLYAWHADSLFGPWSPHQCNPIKTDITSSRPGGTPFIWQGRLIRPAQDCSTTYGAAVVLNQIEQLTPREFKEKTVAIVKPAPRSRYRDGLHTLSVVDNEIIIDAKRHVFHPLAPYYRWREALLSKQRKSPGDTDSS